jgi:hypothetical protein
LRAARIRSLRASLTSKISRPQWGWATS